jgi:hypothetical protein
VKPGNPPLQSARVLDQLRERIRYMHYSLSTEQVYVYWVRFFIRWSAKGGQMRHPRDMGAPEVEAFLTHLATGKRSINRALSAGGEFRDACVHVNNVDICDAEQLRGIERIGGGAQA